MIKEHRKTGLRYLCKTVREDFHEYSGSGKTWLAHLDEHGYDFDTQVLLETEDKDEFRRVALEYSSLYNVTTDSGWANQRPEEGDGGATTSGKIWITNGEEERNIFPDELILDGWRRGRCKGAFLDPKTQSTLSKRSDRGKAGLSIKSAWENRETNKFGSRNLKGILVGEKNPAKRPEVKEKIRQAALSREYPPKPCPRCGGFFKNLGPHKKACHD